MPHASPGEMSLFDHLRELRRRIIWSAALILAGSFLAYAFSHDIFMLLARPFQNSFPNQSLVGSTPAEAFLLRLKISVFAGIVIASPLLFHQVWLFIAPGLYSNEKRYIWPFVLASSSFFIGGVCFAYLVIAPIAFDFFYRQYQDLDLRPMVSMSAHSSMVAQMLLAFGLIFELPVLAYLLGRLGIIDANTLLKYGRHAIVGIFVVAAILTPPDVLSQLLMAGPMLALYGLSILILKLTTTPVAPKQRSDKNL